MRIKKANSIIVSWLSFLIWSQNKNENLGIFRLLLFFFVNHVVFVLSYILSDGVRLVTDFGRSEIFCGRRVVGSFLVGGFYASNFSASAITKMCTYLFAGW